MRRDGQRPGSGTLPPTHVYTMFWMGREKAKANSEPSILHSRENAFACVRACAPCAAWNREGKGKSMGTEKKGSMQYARHAMLQVCSCLQARVCIFAACMLCRWEMKKSVSLTKAPLTTGFNSSRECLPRLLCCYRFER